MSREDYMIGDTNISVLAKQEKQFHGSCNFIKGVNILKNYELPYRIIQQGIKFKINDINYTYWSKKNRVYKVNENTDLTLNQFIKENNEFFIKKTNLIKEFSVNDMAPGKYKDKTWLEVKNEDPSYIKWMISTTKNIKLKEMLLDFNLDELEEKNKIIKHSPYTMAPGKYKDKTWLEVKYFDLNYIKWMMSITKDIKLRKMLSNLIKH